MNETNKTLGFVVVALLGGVVAWASVPRLQEAQVNATGTDVFPKFKNPLSATRLEVVKFDEDTATIDRFEVAQIEGRWAIPSHHNYPADAEQQMADAAASLVGLSVLEDVSDSPATHVLYGVVDPASPQLKAGDTGVGTRVAVYDAEGKALAELIVGKEVKDAPGLRYVRNGGKGRDHVFKVKFDPSKLSTNFSDWIEKDLLKINTYDIAGVNIKDYTIDLVPQATGQVTLVKSERNEIGLSYDDNDMENRWQVKSFQRFNDGRWVDDPLAENEELATQKLNDLNRALDDLKIVDVQPKPEGLTADLKAEQEFLKDNTAMQSLIDRGFYALGGDVLSKEGQIVCQMVDGTEYVLRFGNIASTSSAGSSASEAESGNDAQGDSSAGGVNRYLLVMARFNKELIPQPKLQEVPEIEAPEKIDEQTGNEEASGDDPVDDAPVAEDSPTEDASSQEAISDEAESEETAPQEVAPREAPAEETVSQESKPDEAAQRSEAESPVAGSAEAVADNSTTADGSKTPVTEGTGESPPANEGDSSPQPETPSETAEQAEVAKGKAEQDTDSSDAQAVLDNEAKADEIARQEMRRKQIELANERSMDEYEGKVAKGMERVKELNDRFAEWYYIISDDVFQKIHLGRKDIVKEKSATTATPTPGQGRLGQPGIGSLNQLNLPLGGPGK